MHNTIRRWAGAYLVFVGFVSCVWAFLQVRARSGWALGEWLISYAGGFVRRGLAGSALLLASHLFHLPLWLAAFDLQAAIFIIFLAAVWILLLRVTWSPWLAALFLSPATLSFLALDPPNGFKKEILLFAGLAWLAAWRTRQRPPDWVGSFWLTLFASALVLTHEGLVFWLPYLAAPIWLHAASGRRAAALLTPPALAAGAAALAGALHPGTRATAEAACAAVGGTLPPGLNLYQRQDGVCAGGIAWLQVTLPQAHRYVMTAVHANHDFRRYGLLGALALLPAAAALRELARAGRSREAHIILACALTAALGSLNVFYSGRDWGRWIHIHAVCLLVLLLFARQRLPQVAKSTARRRNWTAIAALALYATAWNLPAVDIYPAQGGYFGLAHYLAHKAHTQPRT